MDTEFDTVAQCLSFSTCEVKEGWSGVQGQFELHNKSLYPKERPSLSIIHLTEDQGIADPQSFFFQHMVINTDAHS